MVDVKHRRRSVVDRRTPFQKAVRDSNGSDDEEPRWMDKLRGHALADELIQAGLLPLDVRDEFVRDFEFDPAGAREAAKDLWLSSDRINEKTDRGRTRYGEQPVQSLLMWEPPETPRGSAGRIRRRDNPAAYWSLDTVVSELVGYSVTQHSLERWIDGFSVPPAEVKLAMAQYLGVTPQMCWTEEVMNATYSGPRGVSGRSGRQTLMMC